MRSDRQLVIGAGPVGLGLADALNRHGIAYDHVDANDAVGGLWQRGAYSTVHIFTSRTSTAYVDYPMPPAYPDFPGRQQMQAYLADFARDRGILDRIELRRRVETAVPQPDGSWQVTLDGGETRTYKGLVVCNGHHWDPAWPDYPGEFSGHMIHSSQYTGPADLAGKRVLVIGGGNSGCDIASEAARVGASCEWSLRSGVWFLPKEAFGRPLSDLPIWGLPVFVQRLVLRALIRVIIGDYRRYGLQRPTDRMFVRHPTFGTEPLGYIKTGRIRPRAGIARFDGETVHFVDGSSGRYDLIVAATGFHNSLPFLPAGLVEVKNDVVQVYGGAFPAHVRNLCIVGSTQPRNGFGSLLTPVADFYARLIELQDEFPAPIGLVLKRCGDTLPTSQEVNPVEARRYVALARHLMPLFRLVGKSISRRHETTTAARQPVLVEEPAGEARPSAGSP